MKKRIISLFLVFCMTLSFIPAGALAAEADGVPNTTASQSGTPENMPFTDVKPSDWYYSAVRYVRANNFFNGITATTFGANGTLTRGMFVTVLGRMAGVDTADYPGETGFGDVKNSSYCAPYVQWAAKYGITSGAGNGLFLPDATVTRQQMAAFLVRYFDAFQVNYDTGENVTTLPDDLDKVAPYARDAVTKLWKQGLLNGNGVSFDPEGNATRAQTAVICMRTDKTVDSWYSEPGVKSDRVSVDPDAAQKPETKPNTKPTTSNGSHSSSGGSATTSYLVEFALGDNDPDTAISMPESKTYPAGTPISQLPTPVKAGMVFLGWYYDKALTKGAEAADTVDRSMTLYAKVAAGEEVSAIETPNYVTKDGVSAGKYTFALTGVENADGAFKFVNITGGNIAVDCTVNGKSVTADLEAGQTYQVELTDDNARFVLDGAEQLAAIRYLNILTAKGEVKNAKLNTSVQQVDVSKTEGLSDTVFKGLYQVDNSGIATQNTASGTFTYKDSKLQIGDVLAVKDGTVNLDDVTSTEGDVAYIKITAVNTNDSYSYEMADVEDVLFMPDVLPVQNDWDKDKTDGKVLTIAADNLSTAMSNVNAKSLDEGDFISFINGAYDADSTQQTTYGKITHFSNEGGICVIEYTDATESDIENSLDVYYSKEQQVEVSKKEQQEIESQILQDFEENEVAEQTAAYLAAVMSESDNLETVPDMAAVAQRMENTQIVRSLNGVYACASGSKAKVNFDRNKIKIEVGANRWLDHLQGRGFKVRVNVPFEVELGDHIKIEVTAVFDEEVILRQSISTKRHKIGFLRYDYSLNAAFDVGNYTGIGFTANMSTGDGDEDENMIDKLSGIMDEMKEFAQKPDGITSTGGSMDSLSEIYREVMSKADDTWTEILNVKLFENNGNAFLHIFCWQVKGSFIVSANLAVSLGMSFDYTTQKRYNFSVRVKSRQTTNQTIDIITPQYNFDFYVVGTIGIRAGLRLEMYVGLFSLKLDKIGITADVGAYAQLWGYFFYHLAWKQGAGKTENSAGAMMIEIGMYLDIRFVAQAFNSSKLTWNPTIYANQWPLWSAGEMQNVYAFADGGNTSYTLKAARTMTLPTSTYDMRSMDLKSGELGTVNKDSSQSGPNEQNFYITFSNPSFTYNAAGNTVTVKPVTAGSLKEDTDMTITWKKAALAFTSKPIQKIIHIAWSDPEGERYISFDSVGGSAIAQLTGGAGMALSWPADPVKQGYVFDGWYKDSAYDTKAETLTTMPSFSGSSKGMTLYAKWRPAADTKYKVEHYQEQLGGGYVNTESEKLTGTTESEAAVPVKEYPGFHVKSAEKKTIAPDGSTVVKVYYDRNEYTVMFNLDNGTENVVQTYKHGADLHAPTPSRSGYTFAGWNSELPKIVTEGAEYAAKWTANDNAVTFVTNGGTDVAGQTVKTDAKITEPSAPEKTGYTFGGWYTDLNCTKAWNFDSDKVSDAMTLYAKWTANTYDVTLDLNYDGAAKPENVTVTYDGTYSALTTPVRAGYDFLGWFTAQTGGEQVTADSKVSITAPQTLYAHWKEGAATYTVKHYQQNTEDITDNNYTEFESETLSGITGQQTEAKAKTYTGFAPAKEFKQSAIAPDSSTVISIYYDRLTYTVTWMNGDTELKKETLRYGAMPNYSGATPTKEGTGHTYTFTGWSPEPSEVTGNVTYTAQFSDSLNTYNITYNLNNGTNASGNPSSYTYGTAVTLADPTRTGYTFGGWFENADFTGKAVTEIPADATGNKTFYAKWTANEYTVTFDANEGTVTPESKTVTYDGTYGELPTPKRSGYKFLGWFTDLTGTDKVTADNKVSITAAQTLYAHWSEDDSEYPLWVNNTRVTAKNADNVFNDGKVSYDAGTNTLTLNNCNITADALTAESLVGTRNNVTAVIKYWDGFYDNDSKKKPLNLVLNGTNTLLNAMSDENVNVGIYTLGDLIISGDGSLEVRGGLGNSNTKITKSYGMYIGGNLTINSGTIHAYSTKEKLSYDGADKMAYCECYGIYVMKNAIAGDMIVNGGTVVAEGTPHIDAKSTGASATGVSGGIFVQNKLTIKDGAVTANGAESITVSGNSGSLNQARSVGVALKHLAVDGGSLSANSKKACDNGDQSYGIWSYDTFSSDGINASITISSGSVLATSGGIAVSASSLSLNGVTAQVSTDMDGTDHIEYTNGTKLEKYKWFSAH
mgnify:CR=1 FL=1